MYVPGNNKYLVVVFSLARFFAGTEDATDYSVDHQIDVLLIDDAIRTPKQLKAMLLAHTYIRVHIYI